MLAANGCLARCDWRRTTQTYGGLPLFRCVGCASEWVRSEAWTPAQADGTVPPAVLAERATDPRDQS